MDGEDTSATGHLADETRHEAIALAVEDTEPQASNELLSLLYEELRSLARVRLGRIPPGQTLQPTALVHEVWMRIADRRPDGWDGRAHFFHAAARAMRDILVEDARRKAATKRGGDRRRIGLADAAELVPAGPDTEDGLPDEDIGVVSAAIDRLSAEHPRAAEVTMLRYFAGLTKEETARVLDTSPSTVVRSWRLARAWLHRELDAEIVDLEDAAGSPEEGTR